MTDLTWNSSEGIITQQIEYLTVFSLTLADFQNISSIAFEQSIVFHKVAVQNIYNVYYFKTSSMCIFNAVKKQSGIGFLVDALFGNFADLHNLYIVVELHTNFVLIHCESQPLYRTSIFYNFEKHFATWLNNIERKIKKGY